MKCQIKDSFHILHSRYRMECCSFFPRANFLAFSLIRVIYIVCFPKLITFSSSFSTTEACSIYCYLHKLIAKSTRPNLLFFINQFCSHLSIALGVMYHPTTLNTSLGHVSSYHTKNKVWELFLWSH